MTKFIKFYSKILNLTKKYLSYFNIRKIYIEIYFFKNYICKHRASFIITVEKNLPIFNKKFYNL